MIRRLFVSIFMILLLQTMCLSVEHFNSKQLEEENKVEKNFSEYAEKDKSIPYKLLIIEDYMVTYLIGGNNRSIGNDIKSLLEKYKGNPNSYNYQYSYKLYELYNTLWSKIEQERTHKQGNIVNIKDKIITVPDEIYAELDDEILKTMFLLNVTARHF